MSWIKIIGAAGALVFGLPLSGQQEPACSRFRPDFVPFVNVHYISEPNADGDRLVVGDSTPDLFGRIRNELPLPELPDQRYCDPVQLAPDLWADAYVPTGPERQGDFRAFAELLVDPASGEPFPNGIIPASRFPSPFAWRIVSEAQPRPILSEGGVLNTASYLLDGLPNSGIAQGSMFVVFGENMGPAELVQAPVPLPTELAGTSVQVSVGGTTVDALMFFSFATQLAAVLPSNTPAGEGTLTVTVDGQTSAPVSILVKPSAFGIFTRNQSGYGPAIVQNFVSQTVQPVNSFIDAAAPGQAMILWGTGLGPIAASDAELPPVADLPVEVEVLVGGRTARHFYAGRSPQFPGIDQINFFVPEGVEGCYVPVAVKVDGVVSNHGSIAVATEGKYCSDPLTFSAEALQAAEQNGEMRMGGVSLFRQEVIALQEPMGEEPDEEAGATFWSLGLNDLLATFGPWAGFGLAMPPPGACTALPDDEGVVDPVTERAGVILDAGTALELMGPAGPVRLEQSDGGYGVELEVGDIQPGMYTLNGGGGADIGAFDAGLTVPTRLTLTNMDSLANVSRASDFTITWSGGDPMNGFVLVWGFSDARHPTGGEGSFVCLERAGAGSLTVPATVLSTLPASAEGGDNGLAVVGIPGREASEFTATGLDLGLFFYLDILEVEGVNYQ